MRWCKINFTQWKIFQRQNIIKLDYVHDYIGVTTIHSETKIGIQAGAEKYCFSVNIFSKRNSLPVYLHWLHIPRYELSAKGPKNQRNQKPIVKQKFFIHFLSCLNARRNYCLLMKCVMRLCFHSFSAILIIRFWIMRSIWRSWKAPSQNHALLLLLMKNIRRRRVPGCLSLLKKDENKFEDNFSVLSNSCSSTFSCP